MLDQQKQMLEELMATETHFHTLVEAIPAGIYLTDAQGDCTYVNPYWSVMAGLSLEEAAGQGWVHGLHPDDRALVAAQWYKLVESAGRWALEYRFQTWCVHLWKSNWRGRCVSPTHLALRRTCAFPYTDRL